MNKIINNDDKHYYLNLDQIIQLNVPIYIDNCILTTIPNNSEGNKMDNSICYQLGDLKRSQNLPKSLVRKQRIHTKNMLDFMTSSELVSTSPSIVSEYQRFNWHLSGSFSRLGHNSNYRGGKDNKKINELKKLVYVSNDLIDCLNYKSKNVSIEERKNIEQLTGSIINKQLHHTLDGRYMKRKKVIENNTDYADAELVSTAIVKSMGYKSNESIILTLDMDVVNIARNFNYLSDKAFVHVYIPDLHDPSHQNNYIKSSQVDKSRININQKNNSQNQIYNETEIFLI